MAITNHESASKALERAQARDSADSAKTGFTYDQQVIDQLRQLIATCGGITEAADKLHLRPSTLRKIINRIPISEATRQRFDQAFGSVSIAGHATYERPTPSVDQDPLREKLQFFIESCGGVEVACVQLGINASTIKKIIDGLPVSDSKLQKIDAILRTEAAQSIGISGVLRAQLQKVHDLFEKTGSLEAVGQEVGLSREEVRKLLAIGSILGIFKYKPRKSPQPQVAREKLIADITKYDSLQAVALTNNITSTGLRQLLTAYGISSSDVKSLRCVKEYQSVVKSLGHHPANTELRLNLYQKIRRLWGSIDAFRAEFNIPEPPGDSPLSLLGNTRSREPGS